VLRTALAAVLLVAGVAACGRASSERPGAPTTSTVTARLADNGDTVELRPGDRLVLSLGRQTPVRFWALARFPRAVLSLRDHSRQRGLYVLRARTTGRGEVLAYDLAGRDPLSCDKRLGARARCPLRAPGAKLAPGPGRVFRLTVVVS
jgi:hypothetical protein